MDKIDEFLKVDASYTRLWEEYQKYGSLVIACDFDSTLFDYHGKGESYEMVKQLVRDLHKIGCKIIIWSGTEDISKIDNYLSKENIPWDTINENILVNGKWVDGKDSRKVYYNCLLDDRSGLLQVYNDLKKLVANATKKILYRVAHSKTGQGLWYDSTGNFTGLIHNEFNFCKNTELKMDFDPELVGWLSAADSLEALYQWFTEEDIKELQKHGWCITKYEISEYKFYERFQHYIIKQDNITFLEDIKL